MADRLRILKDRTDLGQGEKAKLRALILEWGVLADLSFSDLILWVPTWDKGGYTAVEQIRPTTGPSELPENVLGDYASTGRLHLVDRAMASGKLVYADARPTSGTAPSESTSESNLRIGAIPVSHDGRVIAVLESRQAPRVSRGSELEISYGQTALDIANMIVAGDFPSTLKPSAGVAVPRVGDGMIRLDREGVVKWASPNAVSAFQRLGLASDLINSKLIDVVNLVIRVGVLADESLPAIASGEALGSTDVDNDIAAVTLTSLPLTHNNVRIASVLFVRDVTDLRDRERALISKDATIREIHHRVKNNLQTVSALLRLQARRIDDPSGKASLQEAVRRVGAIAVVHESLAVEPGGFADFDDVGKQIVAMTVDLAEGATVRVTGSAGRMPTETATALAMVLAEVLANSTEHGSAESDGAIELRFVREDQHLTVTIADVGDGLPQEFEPDLSSGLGMEIIKSLVRDELKGTVVWKANIPVGTVVEIEIDVLEETAEF